jgi:glutathione S-transferase
VIEAMREALPVFGRQIAGYDHPDVLLTGVETRTSSPIRITRGKDFQSLNTPPPACSRPARARAMPAASSRRPVDGIKVAEAVAQDLNPTWSYAFLALGRPTPGYDDVAKIAASVEAWNKAMAILDGQLQITGAHAAGHDFTLADVVLGVSVHRWMATPMERAALPAVEAYYARLKARPEFGRWALDEIP